MLTGYDGHIVAGDNAAGLDRLPSLLQPEHVDLLPGTTELRLRVPLAYFEVASQADRAGASPLE